MRVGGHARVEMLNGVETTNPTGRTSSTPTMSARPAGCAGSGCAGALIFGPGRVWSWTVRKTLLPGPYGWTSCSCFLSGRSSPAVPGAPRATDPTNLETWSVSLLGEWPSTAGSSTGTPASSGAVSPRACRQVSSRKAPEPAARRPARSLCRSLAELLRAARGVNSIVERLLRGLPLHLGTSVSWLTRTSPSLCRFRIPSWSRLPLD